MPIRNELNDEQNRKVNMIELVDASFREFQAIYNAGNVVIKNKITLYYDKKIILDAAVLKKIHDASGEHSEKENRKHNLANIVSRKGKAASVYYKEQSEFAIEAMLLKEPWEIFGMTDSVCISFSKDVRKRLDDDKLLLANYGTSVPVIADIDNKILLFHEIKTEPKAAQESKDVGGDDLDKIIVIIIDIFHDLDNMIPDAYTDTHNDLVADYEAKRIEITVGKRHNILNLAMHLNPSHNPATNATFTIKDAHGATVKILHTDLHGMAETILRMAEYTGTTSCPGYHDKTITFRPNFRSHLDLGFDLDPII